MTNGQLKHLLKGYRQRTLGEEEVRELENYIKSGRYDNEIQEDIQQALEELSIHPLWTKEYADELWSRVENETTGAPAIQQVHRIHFLKTAWFRYAAAIILIVTGVGIYYLIDTPKPDRAVVQTTPPSVPVQDVLPGSDRAVLTLSDGKQVQLNNAASETINDGDLAIENENGELVYGGNPPAPGGATPFSKGGVAVSQPLNTMSTPKGGQYKLTLSDGTKVWLNAASSITYPIAFTGKTREVSVIGEAYFEVSKNKEKPFIVSVGNSPALSATPFFKGGEGNSRSEEAGSNSPSEEAESLHSPFEKGGSNDVQRNADRRGISPQSAIYRIEVLGTSFNVNTYSTHPSKTTLLEGSIRLSSAGGSPTPTCGGLSSAGGGGFAGGETRGGSRSEHQLRNSVILTPGQQATLENNQLTISSKINLKEILAWKNGTFYFDNEPLKSILEEFSRWYDVEVIYKGKITNRTFFGIVSRNKPLSHVLKLLEANDIKFQIDGRKLIVQGD